MNKILLIGCGHMGNALLESWINLQKYQITVIDPIKYKQLKQKYKNKKINIFKKILFLNKSEKFKFIIIATRPVELVNVLKELEYISVDKKTTMISVIAGKKIQILQKKFKAIKNFFRIMPNMPASIGESMNCIVANKNANKKIIYEVNKLFSYSGKTIFLKNENQIDMATAISGSGPGFIFNLIDAMENGAIKLGIRKDISKTLILQTFKGSINLMLNNKVSSKTLVQKVSTKGGTTEAGLKIMTKYKIHKMFVELMKASYNKAKQQGK
tara:strand:+ start:8749 stop:9558 length:810 start_codon:yes stop_codon:yes gene_type:complete